MNGTNVVRTVVAYAAGGTAATLFVAAGVARLLQGMTSGPTAEAFQYQGTGILFTFVGWVIFVVLAINAYGALTGAGTTSR